MHYICIVRDTFKRHNTVELAASLAVIEQRLEKENRARALREKPGEVLLVYYECLPTLAEAKKRKEHLLSASGIEEAQKWLQRWDRAEVID
ncbi:MAG TPA: hypothetical protein P5079_09005 [Elusimicrobiota bacterium]|nr:hypothetical protein [Elusimicrobiota bacterium]